MEKEVENQIKNFVLMNGADVCGIGNIDRFTNSPDGFNPKDLYTECKSVIVFGIALPKGILKVEPRLIYGHFNYEACPEVDWIAFKTAREIEKTIGGFSVPLPSDSPYEYWEEEKKHLFFQHQQSMLTKCTKPLTIHLQKKALK